MKSLNLKPWATSITGAALIFMVSLPNAFAVPMGADVITVVDESGSMGGEHAFLTTAISNIETGLQTAGVASNQYGLVGYGGHSAGGANSGHKHAVGGGDYGTAAQYSTAAGTLVTSGGTEDGYAGINFALNNYTFRVGDFARQIILVTDEDRDNTNGALTFNSILASLNQNNVVLNVVVNNPFFDANGARALGISSDGTTYTADGAGGFIALAGGTSGNGAGNTENDYVPMALQAGGAAWDLNLLRAGGLTAQSFGEAFTAIKVQEITTTTPNAVPEPGTVFLFGTGIAGLAAWRMRKAKQV